jgi:hypothetical protein
VGRGGYKWVQVGRGGYVGRGGKGWVALLCRVAILYRIWCIYVLHSSYMSLLVRMHNMILMDYINKKRE